MVDYFAEVRRNLAAAADKKAAERKAEAKAMRKAKIALICLLIMVFITIAIIGNPTINF